MGRDILQGVRFSMVQDMVVLGDKEVGVAGQVVDVAIVGFSPSGADYVVDFAGSGSKGADGLAKGALLRAASVGEGRCRVGGEGALDGFGGGSRVGEGGDASIPI